MLNIIYSVLDRYVKVTNELTIAERGEPYITMLRPAQMNPID